MSSDATFVFHADWLDSLYKLPVEQQNKVIAELVRYGCERELQHEDDIVVSAFVNTFADRIDYQKDKYDKKKYGGAKKKVSNQQIYDLAQTGMPSMQLAEMLGVSKSSIDHSDGWKKRKINGIKKQ